MPLYLKPIGAGHASSEPFAISVDTGELSVGRDESNDLRVTQASVSSRHARLTALSDASIEVVDCGSSHGTFVNGERIATKSAIPGDRIRFANAEFEVATCCNGDTPLSDKSALETRGVPPIGKLKELEDSIIALKGQLTERDAEIERLRDALARAEAGKRVPSDEEISGEWQHDIEEKKLELSKVQSDLERLRHEVDEEIRRGQKLSRRHKPAENSQGGSLAMVALDSEQEAYRALIQRIELFDQMIAGYRRSRKYSEIADELQQFREKLAAILANNGVEPFELEIGTILTPRHRKEVQILERKGWGTRKFIERQFRPGAVSRIVRAGYRIGDGDQTAILRKVEVLIKEAEV